MVSAGIARESGHELFALTIDYNQRHRIEIERATVDADEHVEVETLSDDFFKVVLRYGFAEDQNVPQQLMAISECGLPFDMMDTTFFLSRESIVATDNHGMPLWRDKLFAFLQRNALPATAYFEIPGNRLIELGTQVEI